MSQLGSVEIISNPIEVIVTNQKMLDVVVSAEVKSLDITANSIQGQQGLTGATGKSAYQIAVDNGFVGTEQDWLDSLGAESLIVDEEITITPLMITNKELTLQFVVTNPSLMELVVFGGIHQRPMVDFLVTSNKIQWNSLALELLLDVGTVIRVRYNK